MLTNSQRQDDADRYEDFLRARIKLALLRDAAKAQPHHKISEILGRYTDGEMLDMLMGHRLGDELKDLELRDVLSGLRAWGGLI